MHYRLECSGRSGASLIKWLFFPACLFCGSCTNPISNPAEGAASPGPEEKEQNIAAPRILSMITSENGARRYRGEKLDGEEIRAKLLGKEVTPSESQPVAPYGEQFGENGEWHYSIVERALRQFAGKWYIDNDSVCVIADGIPTDCREVWSGEKANTIFMREPLGPSRAPVELSINPIRTVHRKER